MKEEFIMIKNILKIIFVFVLMMVLSWGITCGIVKLITMCFAIRFKWSFATGIWLILFLLNFKVNIG